MNSARETPYTDISTMGSMIPMTVSRVTAAIKTTIFTNIFMSKSITTSDNIMTDYNTIVDSSATYTSMIATTNMTAPALIHVSTATITPKQTPLSSIQTAKDTSAGSAPFHTVEITASTTVSFHTVRTIVGTSVSFNTVETTISTAVSLHTVQATVDTAASFNTVETTADTAASFNTVETTVGTYVPFHTVSSLFTPETIILSSVTSSFSKSSPHISISQYTTKPFLAEATVTTTVPYGDSTIPTGEMGILLLQVLQ